MKTGSFILSLFLLLLIVACENNDEISTNNKKGFGTVVVVCGIKDCQAWIDLDDGTKLIPINWTDFDFVSNERVEVTYESVDDQNAPEGEICKLITYNPVNCTPYVNLFFYNIDSLKCDPVIVHEVTFDSNCLKVKLSYSGGCQNHTIDLARIHPSCGTPPLPPPTFEIRHNANGDNCEAAITKEYMFDLSPLKDEFNKHVTIVLNANEGNGSIYHIELTYIAANGRSSIFGTFDEAKH